MTIEQRAVAANALSAKLDELCDINHHPTSVILAALAKTTAIVLALSEDPEHSLRAHEKSTRELLLDALNAAKGGA